MSRFWRILLGVCGLLFLAMILSPIFQAWSGGNHVGMRRGACMSNMKQLGLALTQYSQDWDGILPPLAAPNQPGWREAIYPFAQSPYAYCCPDDKRGSNRDASNRLPKSYAANALCLNSSKQKTILPNLSPTAILAADTRSFDGEDWNMTDPAFLPGSGRKLYAHFPSHAFYNPPPGRLNVLFADGHVKSMPPMATLVPFNLWTPDGRPFAGTELANAQAILKNAENE